MPIRIFRAEKGPTGGAWTWRNRLHCHVKGHLTPERPTYDTPALHVYLCARCNAESKLVDREYKKEFRTLLDWAKFRDRINVMRLVTKVE